MQMEIALMRHGEPDFPEFGRVAANAFRECLTAYDLAGLCCTSRPNNLALNRFFDYEVVVASDLRRSQESALVFATEKPLITDSIFREVDLPRIQIPGLKLRPQKWAYILLSLWWIGVLDSTEQVKTSKNRAQNGAQKLVKLAQQHGKILLVGHGLFNSYIAKELKNQGWVGPSFPGKRHWEFGVYRKNLE
jgi:broad specificity phosphatase PhoE